MKLMTLSSPSVKGSQIIPIVSMKNAPVRKSVALGHSSGWMEKEGDAQVKWTLKMAQSCWLQLQKMKGLTLEGDVII